MFDANADNLRLLNHFFDTNHAQSTKELLAILKKYQGIPWVNTIAADSKGKALYADIGSIPNVPNEKATGCAGALGAITFPALGLPTLDGSRSECAPGTDPDSAAEGIFGPSNLPQLKRRDYVANSNDSYWLANPEQPLEGFARIIGDERTERTLRDAARADDDRAAARRHRRLRRRQVHPQPAAPDRVQRPPLRRPSCSRDQLAAFCNANPMLTGSGGPVDVSEACPVLDG